ncbi:ABC transporter ATP-binding protein [Zhihengliuella flava]|uniref:Simple sugar transport system ATP-binding protein n=1 Tax=Zhihengliuella flava TaxID=1285193 RepID=A0A931D414_9MICC|nr:ABC transporter ATP-binding protein [Zhihengliuella flava]MBG6084014.1 simple sugar transport system ATP-binding protein [Zhihengliuella flava]
MKLELTGISKAFGDFYANDSIDLLVEPGKVHTLLGENGAGKSTLMNVLYGLYEPTAGQIRIDDSPVQFRGPGDAMAAGIGMVHQHFMLVPVFTVAENVALGDEHTKAGGILDLEQTRRRIREISDKYGFHVDPDAVVEDLPVGVQQRVEIIKALVRKADLLILDEPTAVLTPKETDELMDIIRQLKADGTSIIFISHKLREVKAISDDITVIRRGKVVGQADPSADAMELASLMVGRAVDLSLGRQHSDGTEVALTIEDLTVIDGLGVPTLDHVSLEVRKGEILAVAGVQGNGQTELVEAIMGLTERTTGSVRLGGQELLGRSTKEIINSGVGYVPEDRSTDGVIGDFSIADNLVLNRYDRAPVAKGGTLQLPFIAENAAAKIDEFDIRTQSAQHTASQLSGGNQQKVVLAREFSRDLNLFIASQPTRGVDVGSIEFLHRRILAERDKDVPVIVVSTELDEVAELGDRIAVLFHGRLMGIVPGNTSRDVLGLMMAGSTADEAFAEAEAAHLNTTEHDEPQLPGGIA